MVSALYFFGGVILGLIIEIPIMENKMESEMETAEGFAVQGFGDFALRASLLISRMVYRS